VLLLKVGQQLVREDRYGTANRFRYVVQYGIDASFVFIQERKILEEHQIKRFEEAMIPVIERNDRGKLVLDFGNVDFMSSSMLGLLVKIHKRVAERKGTLQLSGVSPEIQKIFKITRLDKIFDIQ
jgi:anti-sigma B factor antagonist